MAAAWQSAAVEAGEPQLVLQKVSRFSQLWSGSAVADGMGGPVTGSDEAGGAVHVPRSVLLFISAQFTVVPPMHALSPHASVRRSPLFSTRQVHGVSDGLHAGSASADVKAKATRARASARSRERMCET